MASNGASDSIGTAAVSWTDSTGVHIRVYSTDGDNVTERYNDGDGWKTGTLNVPGSEVSATCWAVEGGYTVRLYATVQFESTTEWCNGPDTKGEWVKGAYTPG
ncbi:MAG: fucose-binding lectin protein [Sphingomonadaceae bacterium]|nr:fucose-binding lectin protein [Sphingomonadaceae bacterium]